MQNFLNTYPTGGYDYSQSPNDTSDYSYVHPIQPIQQPQHNPYTDNGLHRLDQLAFNSKLITNSLGDTSAADTFNRKKAEQLKFQMIVDSEKLLRNYGDFVMKVYTILESLNTNYRLVQMKTLHMSPISSSSVCMPEVSNANDLIGVFKAFHKYASWFNYELIKIVAEDFGGAMGKTAVVEYEKILKKFMERFLFQVPELMPNAKIPPNFEGLTMKIDQNYFSSSANTLPLIKARIIKLTNIEPHRLLLRSVEDGCIKTTWWIPSSYLPIVLERLTTQNRQLVKMKVKAFFIAGKDFDTYSTNRRSLSLRDIPNLSQESNERRNSNDSSNDTSTLTSYSSTHTFSDYRFRSFRRSKRTKSESSVNTSVYNTCQTSDSEMKCEATKKQGIFKLMKNLFSHKAKSTSHTSCPKHSNCLHDDDNDGFLQYNSQSSDNNQEKETDEHYEQEHEQLLEVPAIKDTSQVHEGITSVLCESSSHNEDSPVQTIRRKTSAIGIGLSPSHSDFDLRKNSRTNSDDFHDKRVTMIDVPKEGTQRELMFKKYDTTTVGFRQLQHTNGHFVQSSKERSDQSFGTISSSGYFSRENLSDPLA